MFIIYKKVIVYCKFKLGKFYRVLSFWIKVKKKKRIKINKSMSRWNEFILIFGFVV